MTDLNERLAAFAQETGRTTSEWLELWREGRIAKTDAAQERYRLAVSLDEASKNQVTLDGDER